MNTTQLAMWMTSPKCSEDVPRWYRGRNTALLGDVAGPVDHETDAHVWIIVAQPGKTGYDVGMYLGAPRQYWEEIEPCGSL